MKKSNPKNTQQACSCPHDHNEPPIALKKQFGQHFLRDETVVDQMIDRAKIQHNSSVLEIGCGDGFLTHAILEQSPQRLWIVEIDPEWATYVGNTYAHPALTVFQQDILTFDFEQLTPHVPWLLLANLPYQITFPLLYKLQQHRQLFAHIIIMIQEEVAQKLLATSGRSYGIHSLFFQRYFSLESICRVAPSAFEPPPKVNSRVLSAQPRATVPEIFREEQFWKFVKSCFAQPRRTFLNNLLATPYASRAALAKPWHHLRAQQMSFEDLMQIWTLLQK